MHSTKNYATIHSQHETTDVLLSAVNQRKEIMKIHSERLQETNPLDILKQFLNPSTQSNTVGSTTDLLKLVLNELVKINAVFDKLLNEEKRNENH